MIFTTFAQEGGVKAHAKKYQRNYDCIKSGPDNNSLG